MRTSFLIFITLVGIILSCSFAKRITKRTRKHQTEPEHLTPAVTDTLPAGKYLTDNEMLVSKNGKYFAVLEIQSNFVVYREQVGSSEYIIWRRGGWENYNYPHKVIMQSDGNLVVFDGNNEALWATDTVQSGVLPNKLVMQDNGNLVLQDSDGNIVWESGTAQIPSIALQSPNALEAEEYLLDGEKLVSNNGQYTLELQKRGSLVLTKKACGEIKKTWTSGDTSDSYYPHQAIMQTDGNFCIYNRYGYVLWCSATYYSGTPPHKLVLNDNGNLALVDSTGYTVWETHTTEVVPVTLLESDSLNGGEYLIEEQKIVSKNGVYSAVMQTDGNLVIYKGEVGVFKNYIWQSGTGGNDIQPHQLILTENGDLIIYDGLKNQLLNTYTSWYGTVPFKLNMRDDGNLVLTDSNGWLMWHSNSVQFDPITLQSQDTVEQGEYIMDNQKLVSKNGKYSAVLKLDGELTVKVHENDPEGKEIWNIGSYHDTDGPHRLVMDFSGDAIIFNKHNQALWSSITIGQGAVPNKLVMQDDGNLVILDSAGNLLWQSFTGELAPMTLQQPDTLWNGEYILKEQKLVSNNGKFTALLQDDGNFVLYKDATEVASNALWATQTFYDTNPRKLIMENDGNLALYSQAPGLRTLLWQSNTHDLGAPPYKLVMQDDGNLVISDWTNTFMWETRTAPILPITLASADTVQTGEYLVDDTKIVSPNGKYSVVMQKDGNVVLFKGNGASATSVWATNTAGNNNLPHQLKFLIDGNLILYDSQSHVLWRTYMNYPNIAKPNRLIIQDDGNLVIRDLVNTELWSTNTAEAVSHALTSPDQVNANEYLLDDEKIVSPNGIYSAVLQKDANFVLYKGTTPLWASGSYEYNYQNNIPHKLIMQRDGNLVLYNKLNVAIWYSGTNVGLGNPKRLVMKDDGNLVILDYGNQIVWQTSTAGK